MGKTFILNNSNSFHIRHLYTLENLATTLLTHTEYRNIEIVTKLFSTFIIFENITGKYYYFLPKSTRINLNI
jgi:hypothetical protein